MKKLFIIFLAAISCHFVNAQSVGIGTNAPNPKALLDISSTTKGVLLPRMTTSQRFDITTPPNGLVVYDTDKNEFYHHDGLGWKALLNSDYWRRPITSRKRISNLNDSVGINLSGATEWLDVDGNIRSRNNLIVGNSVTAQGNITGGSFSTGGNMLIAGTSLLSGDVTTNSDITINNTAAILQLKSSNVNKGFLQLSGNDLRFGTNSGNGAGKVILRMNGNDVIKFKDFGEIEISGDIIDVAKTGYNRLTPLCYGNSVNAHLDGGPIAAEGTTNVTITRVGVGEYNINCAGLDGFSFIMVQARASNVIASVSYFDLGVYRVLTRTVSGNNSINQNFKFIAY